MINHSAKVTVCHWTEVSTDFERVNPKIHQIINTLNPSKALKLIKMRYSFGELIVKNGVLCLPCPEGNEIDSDKDSLIKEQLNYSPIPMGFLLNKSAEIFVSSRGNIFPQKMLYPGDFFGMFETINFLSGIQKNPIWTVCAGARCTILSTKISDSLSHKRLCAEFPKMPATPPQKFTDHWYCFKAIADEIKDAWTLEIVFFTKNWFQLYSKNDLLWDRYYQSLYEYAWRQIQYTKEASEIDISWHSFSASMTKKNLRPRLQIIDTVKYLLMITAGSVPGFKVANLNDETIMPITNIQNAYRQIYDLKNHPPLLMHSHNFIESTKNIYLYYSLSSPLLPIEVKLGNSKPTRITDLEEIKRIIDTIFTELRQHKTDFVFETRLKCSNFSYLHNAPRHGMRESALTLLEDPLINIYKGFTGDSLRMPFFNGCIRLSLDPPTEPK